MSSPLPSISLVVTQGSNSATFINISWQPITFQPSMAFVPVPASATTTPPTQVTTPVTNVPVVTRLAVAIRNALGVLYARLRRGA
ncbi:hypothetical protein C8R44DRAFT_867700 [Mycena epipterygia]|nr:hypothetical protein C8R44DRAFT_867700 [Mycena epipterygia]